MTQPLTPLAGRRNLRHRPDDRRVSPPVGGGTGGAGPPAEARAGTAPGPVSASFPGVVSLSCPCSRRQRGLGWRPASADRLCPPLDRVALGSTLQEVHEIACLAPSRGGPEDGVAALSYR